ncbi:cytochrome c oxidase subunit II [Conexibacter sp. SYSU D00693]|uniref:cytochrome c oxidase subunit II n=1 Tax=Conexibacter sp. SYSU D00693 TaxID=2812560 RepID=UPI00196A9A1E|nr:cytochrome c oxidase subunit II [Conexibacter sp. SYSU D00693]
MEERGAAAARGGGRRTVTQMLVVGIIASALGIALGIAIDWFPEQGSTQADDIDTLWDVLVIASVPFFVLVSVVVLFAVRDFRVRPGEEHLDGPPIHGSTRLEVIWTTIPAVILVGLCTYAWIVLTDIEEAPAQGPERQVIVTGEQFTWTFEYREGGKTFKTSQLYVPQGESVQFKVRSKDVIHDFWVPDWRMKIDAVPGITTDFRVTPTLMGRHEIVCAELCGIGHAFMRQTATVVTPDDFRAWVAKQTAPKGSGAAAGGDGENQPAEVDGKTLFTEGNTAGATACGACHALSDAGTTATTGPDLDAVLKGKSVEEIKRDIVDPGAEVANGFAPGIMPSNYDELLSEQEVDGLATYLSEVTK